MNSRERVKRAVEGSGPDRIPLLPDVQKSAWLANGEALEEYLNSLPLDRGPFRCVHPEEFGDDIAGSSWMDDWGCVWKRGRAGEYGTVLDHPLSDWSRFDSYTFPDESACGAIPVVNMFCREGRLMRSEPISETYCGISRIRQAA